MKLIAPLRRVLSMDRREIGFRVAGHGRKAVDRVRTRVRRPRWHRSAFRVLLTSGTSADSAALVECRAAAKRRDWLTAHRAFTAHVAARQGAFPLVPPALPALAAHITERFPSAVPEAVAAADRILTGCYDLLGYRGLEFGTPPRWNLDPVHGRVAPSGFWATIPYLDPASGDHKVIWEINRHQHFLALGRAFHLTGDRRYYREFVQQLGSWMAGNPPLQGINWASMLELAFRSLSWLWALHFFAPAAGQDDEWPWSIDLVVALDRQLAHVRHNLSRYFSPNTHLTGEALALYIAGLALPELRSSALNARVGGDVLVAETARQVRADGGHAELSAHYHRYSTDFYLLAAAVARGAGDAREPALAQSAARQAHYLRIIADDSGRLPLIGDDDGGQLFPICGRAPADCRDTLATAAVLLDRPDLQIGPTPEETYWRCGSQGAIDRLDRPAAAPMPPPTTALADTGYYVVRSRSGDHLVFDAGAHGFLNGGHAHADALAIVLCAGGLSVLVDPGTATYTMDASLRDLFRSTAMHNTVVVNGAPQSVPRGPFHWQSRAQARASIWRFEAGFTYVEGQHDGYAPIVHARGVLAVPSFGWVVVDHLVGAGTVSADAYWHLHPDWSVVSGSDDALVLQHRTGRLSAIAASAAVRKLTAAEAGGLDLYAPEYGRIERACTLRMRIEGTLPVSFATFIPSAAVDVRVESIAVRTAPPHGWHAAAFRITSGDCVAELLAAIESDGRVPTGDAGPGAPWGTASTTTDGRLAFSLPPSVLVNGTQVVSTVAPGVHQSSAGRYGRA